MLLSNRGDEAAGTRRRASERPERDPERDEDRKRAADADRQSPSKYSREGAAPSEPAEPEDLDCYVCELPATD